MQNRSERLVRRGERRLAGRTGRDRDVCGLKDGGNRAIDKPREKPYANGWMNRWLRLSLPATQLMKIGRCFNGLYDSNGTIGFVEAMA
ncbi:hypothetical protein Csa_011046 [Cucumis sativus]|uniref:Uncharacterized protein n=1 Tax=Cucumis sativus TaxID=3659 RepID=A0A0A0L801_CUCSA|nr:hypothetical protein Csa_011046 [Cucumis sativus]